MVDLNIHLMGCDTEIIAIYLQSGTLLWGYSKAALRYCGILYKYF
jgi:hypothetical protein